MVQAASPLVFALLTPLAAYGVVGSGRMKSALWTACGEPDLAEYDAAIESAAAFGWIVVDGAHVELTRLGLVAAQHANPPAPTDPHFVPMQLSLASLLWPRRNAHATPPRHICQGPSNVARTISSR